MTTACFLSQDRCFREPHLITTREKHEIRNRLWNERVYGKLVLGVPASPMRVTHMESAVLYTLKYSRMSYLMKHRMERPGPSQAW